MHFLGSLSLAFKLALVLSLVVAGVAATIGGAMVNRDRERLEEELRGKALLIARSVAMTAPEALLRSDTWTLYKMLRQLTQGPGGMADPSLLSAMVLDAQTRVLAHTNPAMFPVGLPLSERGPERPRPAGELANTEPSVFFGDRYIEASAPIQSGGKTIGLAQVRMSSVDLHRKIAEAGVSVLLFSVAIAAIGVILGLVWSVRTLRPLNALSHSMHELARGSVHPVPISRGDEIGHLIASFNRMAMEIEEKRRISAEMAANEKVLALGRIAAGVAHEVNNPLAGMLNCLSTLRANSNDPELVKRYLPMIEIGLKKIEAVVKDLLIELRVEGAQEIADASCLEDLRDLVRAEIGRTNVELIWDNRLDASDALNGPRIQQVLLNLLRNSIAAMPDGGQLHCRCRSDGTTMVFEVEDTGHGIPPENIGRVFDPFFTSKPNGTGLGLWIVLRLVQSMKGNVEVNSVLGKGTTFRLTIPKEAKSGTRAA